MQRDLFALLSQGASFERKHATRAREQPEEQEQDGPAKRPARAPAGDVIVEPITDEEEAAEWRTAHNVKVDGDDVPLPLVAFAHLRERYGVAEHVLRNLASAEWALPTVVQCATLPVLLERHDLIACAPTGSGKTAAFVLPILARLGSEHVGGGPRALIVTPTHELASQIHRVLETLDAGSGAANPLAVCLLTSKRSAKPSRWVDGGSWDIVVATPLRLLQLVQGGNLSLASVQVLVLDEADRLFEADFVEQADAVFAACTNPALQRAMFSATIGERPERLARAVMFSPIRIIVGARVATPPHTVLQQELVYVGTEQGKVVHFRALLRKGLEPPVLVFTQNKQRAMELYKVLLADGLNVDVLSQDRSEGQRRTAVESFRDGRVWILISTDVLGRGIDFKAVNVVINWDMPKSVPDYVHRVGRTGRAGRSGRALTYFEDVDVAMARSVAQLVRAAGGSPPAWLLRSATKVARPASTLAMPRQRVLDGVARPNTPNPALRGKGKSKRRRVSDDASDQ